MRKIFLTTTILLTAGPALAFGGVFSHGSKSTTYKGGVDAIGVHFGGEKKTADSQPEEGTCPAEKQCGEYCCGHDNVCKQNPDSGEYQCCNDRICCDAKEIAYCTAPDCSWGPPPSCCNGEVYCPLDTCSAYQCCPTGNKLYGPLERDNGENEYVCCAENQKPYCWRKFSYGCSYSCCDGTVSPGTGLDGADECLP